jgi:CheY-like chemotaxis protein
MNKSRKDRLLLVDDEKHLLILLKDFLSYEGFDVSVAESGEAALDQLEKGLEPDLIILDISMPGIGGLGFLRRVSGADGKPMYPVLVLTARSKMEEFFGMVDVDGFLAKPCDENKLVGKIREILTVRKASPERQGRIKKQILLADDEESTVRSLKPALEGAGYEVDVVTNGPEILERAPTTIPDLILIKEILPRLNGSAVASLISVMPSLASIPVVIYDETLGETEDLPPRYTNVRCIRSVVRNREPAGILRAIGEAFTR